MISSQQSSTVQVFQEASARVAREQFPKDLRSTLMRHYPEYLMEAFALGIFMFSACSFGVLLEHPDSVGRAAISSTVARRAVMGVAMGLTAIVNIYSPWGRRSGAHMNPAVTLAYFWLGKVPFIDATGYVLAQFGGAIAGVWGAQMLLGARLAQPSVNFVATVPGVYGVGSAFIAELLISFLLMLTVLVVSGRPRLAKYTGICAGALVALYILFEAPVSGMSMNPARTLGSAVYAGQWRGLWIYFAAPILGMFLAVEAYLRRRKLVEVACAKLYHDTVTRCIFCGQPEGSSNR